jgi:hypothetical protein
MSVSMATPVPTISPSEMQLLLSRAGLALNPGQVADLVLAWRQVAALIGSIPHDRPLVDDMACAFRLPPPMAPVGNAAPKPAKPRAKAAAKPKVKAATKPAAKAKPRAKSAPKRQGARSTMRKSASRRR